MRSSHAVLLHDQWWRYAEEPIIIDVVRISGN